MGQTRESSDNRVTFSILTACRFRNRRYSRLGNLRYAAYWGQWRARWDGARLSGGLPKAKTPENQVAGKGYNPIFHFP